MDAIVSIKPQWCLKIIKGEKTIEVRRTAPTRKIGKCYIYCTKYGEQFMHGCIIEHQALFLNPDDKEYKFDYAFELMCCREEYSKDNFLSGKIIGCFTPKIYKYQFDHDKNKITYPMFFDNVGECTEAVLHDACLTIEELKSYLNGKDYFYGWHIKNLEIFDKPKQLSDFGLKRPPQSWQYTSGVKNEEN